MTRTLRHLMFHTVLAVLAGCGSEYENPCGTTGPTTYAGAFSVPGDSCGACGTGVLVCGDSGAELVCIGGQVNACGGCAALPAEPDESCGICGFWTCTGDDTVACEETRNVCGGCGNVDGCASDDDCGEGSACACTGPNETACLSPAANPCGGREVLDGVPGGPCGECGLGRHICDGPEGLACVGDDPEACACAGAGVVEDDPCGLCDGGQWVCDARGWSCDDGRNACGGCEPLDGAPGDPCGRGALTCFGSNELVCSDTTANPCGGTHDLPGVPGEFCGDKCGDGRWVCVAQNRLDCVGETPHNACRGCFPLIAEPGTPCAIGGEWRCDGEAVICTSEDAICGNGIREAGEACDDGPDNGTTGAACTAECDRDTDRDGVGDNFDCQPTDPNAYPGGVERPGDRIDGNCDGSELCFLDADADGVPGSTTVSSSDLLCAASGLGLDPGADPDCADDDPAIAPGFIEVCDGVDTDCNGFTDDITGELSFFSDDDGDGFGDPGNRRQAAACSIDGFVLNDNDCNDDRADANPAADEVCDEIDNDCDGLVDGPGSSDVSRWYRDADGDGFGDSTTAYFGCSTDRDGAWVAVEGDCDDTDDQVYPGAPDLAFVEVGSVAVDNNCDGVDGDLENAILVSPFGHDESGDGTIDAPFRTISRALEASERESESTEPLSIFIAAEIGGTTYEEQVAIRPPYEVSLYGGYHAEDWSQRTQEREVRILSPDNRPAVWVILTSSNIVLHWLTIQSQNATSPGESSIAVRVDDTSSPVTLASVRVQAGRGADGARGLDGEDGVDGVVGAEPEERNADGATPGDGAAGSLGEGFRGGSGGDGGGPGEAGRRGEVPPFSDAIRANGGAAGVAAAGECHGEDGEDGTPGTVGARGTDADRPDDQTPGEWNGNSLVALPGIDGTDARDGDGGSGGGGGGGCMVDGVFVAGGGGGAGASGGTGGAGGTAGGGAGSSIAVVANRATRVRVTTSVVATSAGGHGGDGGNGGIRGGALGTRSGRGGAGASALGGLVTGGNGGRGGNGRRGGSGGAASGGGGGSTVAFLLIGVESGVEDLSTEWISGPAGRGGDGGQSGDTSYYAEDGANGLSERLLLIP